MGRDLTLYPASATRAELKAYIEGLEFVRSHHFWDWPAGTLNYSWFDSTDFKSTDGVSADIYPVSAAEAQLAPRGWALHVRNRYSASWYDVSMLNSVLRGARKRFGGVIHGDYGVNRYAPLWKDETTPISRGISGVYQEIDQDLAALRGALPEPTVPRQQTNLNTKKMRQFAEFSESLDPSRVIYNGLVPFAVSMFEYFFSSTFRILITYDSFAISKKAALSMRVDFQTVLEVANSERMPEDIIASTYSFQNLDQINRAFREWLGIDIRRILFKRKRIGRSAAFLENRIGDIIQHRHGVVHRFELDRSLTRERYIAILDAVLASIKEVIKFLEKKYQMKIETG